MPAGGGSSLAHSGGIGHHARRHYDRCARCSLEPKLATRETPDDYGAGVAKPGPELSLGMRESRGVEPQWIAGRRVRPQRFRVATSESVAHAMPVWCGAAPVWCGQAGCLEPAARLPAFRFLSFLFVVRRPGERSETRERR